MTFMDPQLKLTQALPRNNIREWAVFDEDGNIEHKASCRRCGEKIESLNSMYPVVSFREEHRTCKGRDVKF